MLNSIRFLHEVIHCSCDTYKERRNLLLPAFFIFISYQLISNFFRLIQSGSFINFKTQVEVIEIITISTAFILSLIISKFIKKNPILSLPSMACIGFSFYLLSNPQLQVGKEQWVFLQITAGILGCFLGSTRCNTILLIMNALVPFIAKATNSDLNLAETLDSQAIIYLVSPIAIYLSFKNTVNTKDIEEEYKKTLILKNQNEELNSAVNAIACLINTDLDGKINKTNHITHTLTGISFTEFEKNNVNNFFNIYNPVLDKEINIDSIEHLNQIQDEKLGLILKQKNKVDPALFLFSKITPRYNQAGIHCGYLIICFDISKQQKSELELKEQKELLEHHSKLATIGTLAAGIGHEINNPLSIIMGYTDSLKRLIEENKDQQVSKEKELKYIKKIKIASERISHIAKGLRTFSRSDSSDINQFDSVEALQESVDLLDEIYKKEGVEIKLSKNVKEGSTLTVGNRGKLQQVFINLLSNAKDAIQNCENKNLEISIDQNSKNIIFKFKDHGHGIPEEIREKIFNPFFTTKDVKKGTGIGLSVVNNIVIEIGGTLVLESEVGKGTTFIIEIPYQKNLIAS